MKFKLVVNFIRILKNLHIQRVSTFRCSISSRNVRNNCNFYQFRTIFSGPAKVTFRLDYIDAWRPRGRRTLATALSAQEMVSPTEMLNYLKANNLELEKGFTCWHCSCPAPPGTEQTTAAPPKTVFINMTTGMFIDYDQKLAGPWHVFKDLLNAMNNKKSPPIDVLPFDPDIFLHEDQRKELESTFNSAKPVETLANEDFMLLTNLFSLKKIHRATFKLFDVRTREDGRTLLFPYHDHSGKLSGIRTLTITSLENGKEEMMDIFSPKVSPLSLFSSAPNETRVLDQVVLTGSPLDAMAVTQECGIPAIALPKPHGPLPQEILPRFEKYLGITFWLGSSIQDWETTKTLIQKLGMQRCGFVRPMENLLSATHSLEKGISLKNLLSKSQSVLHKSITTFRLLKDDILQELSNLELASGVKWTRFPGLSRLLKGHRRGELTVFTGPTGAGKTTLMSEYSLDLCSQGVITLWGSFEIPNVRLAKMMLNQFSLIPLEKNLERFEEFANKFEELQLYFLTLHGQQSLSRVLDAMSHAVYVHDIQHVVVDNLQFMMGMDMQGDRFWRQDLVVASFRQFATKNNCHITLVMHPRKENETDELSTNSIFGGVKASQEADNILILQDRRLNMIRGRKYLQVTKNRFDGELGVVPLEFDTDTKSFSVRKKQRTSSNSDDYPSNIESQNVLPKFNKAINNFAMKKTAWSPKREDNGSYRSAPSKFNGDSNSLATKKPWPGAPFTSGESRRAPLPRKDNSRVTFESRSRPLNFDKERNCFPIRKKNHTLPLVTKDDFA